MGGKQHHFVLVHGAGHGAWCWIKIVPVLQKAGHRVTAIDLVSAGENSATAADDVTSLEQYNQPLEDLFASIPDNEKVILVGHSLGGINITRVSELFPNKVSVAVYLAAMMPNSKLYELLAREPHFFEQIEYKKNYKVEGGPPTSVEFTPSILEEYFYNRCSPQDLAFAVDHVRPVPAPAGLLAIRPTTEKCDSVPRIFVLPTDDKSVAPASIRKMVAGNPPNEVYEVDGDHSLYFSNVESLEKILNDAAAKYDS